MPNQEEMIAQQKKTLQEGKYKERLEALRAGILAECNAYIKRNPKEFPGVESMTWEEVVASGKFAIGHAATNYQVNHYVDDPTLSPMDNALNKAVYGTDLKSDKMPGETHMLLYTAEQTIPVVSFTKNGKQIAEQNAIPSFDVTRLSGNISMEKGWSEAEKEDPELDFLSLLATYVNHQTDDLSSGDIEDYRFQDQAEVYCLLTLLADTSRRVLKHKNLPKGHFLWQAVQTIEENCKAMETVNTLDNLLSLGEYSEHAKKYKEYIESIKPKDLDIDLTPLPEGVPKMPDNMAADMEKFEKADADFQATVNEINLQFEPLLSDVEMPKPKTVESKKEAPEKEPVYVDTFTRALQEGKRVLETRERLKKMDEQEKAVEDEVTALADKLQKQDAAEWAAVEKAAADMGPKYQRDESDNIKREDVPLLDDEGNAVGTVSLRMEEPGSGMERAYFDPAEAKTALENLEELLKTNNKGMFISGKPYKDMMKAVAEAKQAMAEMPDVMEGKDYKQAGEIMNTVMAAAEGYLESKGGYDQLNNINNERTQRRMKAAKSVIDGLSGFRRNARAVADEYTKQENAAEAGYNANIAATKQQMMGKQSLEVEDAKSILDAHKKDGTELTAEEKKTLANTRTAMEELTDFLTDRVVEGMKNRIVDNANRASVEKSGKKLTAAAAKKIRNHKTTVTEAEKLKAQLKGEDKHVIVHMAQQLMKPTAEGETPSLTEIKTKFTAERDSKLFSLFLKEKENLKAVNNDFQPVGYSKEQLQQTKATEKGSQQPEIASPNLK